MTAFVIQGNALHLPLADESIDGGDITAPVTDTAKQWDGWGTALKPSSEPIIVARKPLGERTVAGNVQTWGTGAINVDGCRVGTTDALTGSGQPPLSHGGMNGRPFHETHEAVRTVKNVAGRWPTNCVLTHTPDCDEVGTRKVKTGTQVNSGITAEFIGNAIYGQRKRQAVDTGYADADGLETIPAYECAAGCPVAELDAQSDSGSRFFPTFRYQAKAPARERPSYIATDGAGAWVTAGIRKRCVNCGKQQVNVGTSACACLEPNFQPDPSMSGRVSHPTTKPLELMRWLVRLVTPPGGRVLDPFSGSGTTAEACILEGFDCIAIERDATYLPLIAARVKRQASAIVSEDIPAVVLAEVIRLGQLTLEVTV
jgi:DNA methylase